MASVSSLSVQHQVTNLHFQYVGNNNVDSTDSRWFCQAKTTLFVITDDPPVPVPVPSNAASSGTQTQYQQLLAFHLRGSCVVNDVKVESLNTISSGSKADGSSARLFRLLPLRSTFHHIDPLQHVLVKPASTYSRDGTSDPNLYTFDADSQCSRGAVGMTTGLRVASIASNLGELRLAITTTIKKSANEKDDESQHDAAVQAWKTDLIAVSNNTGGNSKVNYVGTVLQRLQTKLEERSRDLRAARVNLIAKRMAVASGYGSFEASDNSNKVDKRTSRAFKVTINYKIPMEHGPDMQHMGGIHVLTTKQTPHIYTTCGLIGDHEGPRSWLPCSDSASVKSRATHCIAVKVTGPAHDGLSCVGCGEDFGASETVLHKAVKSDYEIDSDESALITEHLGTDHVDFMTKIDSDHSLNKNQRDHKKRKLPHVIPIEDDLEPKTSVLSFDIIQATSVWCSHIWTPVSTRSLGFAIGPFKIVEDPEYFGTAVTTPSLDEDDDDDDIDKDGSATTEFSFQNRINKFLEASHRNGEGIRQVYFAPLFERKFIHTANVDSRDSQSGQAGVTFLLPNSEIRLTALSPRQKEISAMLDGVIKFATAGVVHRALSLMRDVLALPTYRTASYTQIWLPDVVHGGVTSGALHNCPECLTNSFLGGAILDSRLLPPVNARLPFYHGGRVLQFLQARCAIRGWTIAALPIGGNDDVGASYLHIFVESFIMSLYERGHGGFGEGGARNSMFYSKRYSPTSGLNSSNLDFLPVQNIEEVDVSLGVYGAVPVEDRNNDQLWRGANNGSESHTSAMDEFNVRQVLYKDATEALERQTDKDKDVPSPSMGWFGSHLSLSFLSSNATSSSDIGCGAVDLLHPVGGFVYRALKCECFRGVVEGRSGVTNMIRLVRAAFIAGHLDDLGEKEMKLPQRNKKQEKTQSTDLTTPNDSNEEPQPSFVVCVNEILKKKGLQHTLFTRVLQNLSGRMKEQNLLGTLVDVERHAEDPRTRRPFVDPEGFPNSYVRGASTFFLKVGVIVEPSRDNASQLAKGIQMQAYAEPIIPRGGVAFGGPITIRVVENEGSFREYVKEIVSDGSRRDWGATFLHAKPVTTSKAQTAASGAVESSKDTSKTATSTRTKASTFGAPVVSNGFTETNFHSGGFQAIELIRLTNLTPLLWLRVDPIGMYGGRISVAQPDACLAEQLFHDGDAGAQVEAIRALSERPLRIQGSMKVTTVYDVNVSELPLRILGDCFRGSPVLHSSLPHTPAVRCQAALASGIWQNNKAPSTKDAVGADNWVGLNVLLQYFRERFYSNSVVMPVKFSRLVLKKSEESTQTTTNADGAVVTAAQPTYDALYQYFDSLDQGEEVREALDEADDAEMEEDEEYRVRCSVTTAIASIRAKDGQTPPLVIQFLETVLESEDAEMVSNLVYPDEELMIEKLRRNLDDSKRTDTKVRLEKDEADRSVLTRSYVSSTLVADALLALCHANSMPATIIDPTSGKRVQSSGAHPLSKLLQASTNWLQWELYREQIRMETEEETLSGISGNCYDVAAACAIAGLSTLSITIQSTTDLEAKRNRNLSHNVQLDKRSVHKSNANEVDVTSAQYYLDIFNDKPCRNDLTRAACAQAISCICCAADRFEDSAPSLGLLCALEFLLNSIIDTSTSPGLRHTLSLIMMDACTGKVCSMQRIGAIAGRNDLVLAANRFLNGALGSGNGGDNGSAFLMSVSAASFPAASAVNDGARRGLHLVTKAGHPKETISEVLIVRVARFATRLWRTINGEPADQPMEIRSAPTLGVCAYDGILRCSLLALWQWIWPKGCYAVLQVQAWKSHEKTARYREMGAHNVMKISDQEKAAASEEEKSLSEINRVVQMELDRQLWRGEMAKKAYDLFKAAKSSNPVGDVAAVEQGIGTPLPPIERDQAFKQGGWIASAAQQRRALALDGGTAVTKVRLTVKNSN